MDRQQADHAQELLEQYLEPIRDYLRDDSVQEIMINSSASIWVEQQGRIFRIEPHLDDTAIRSAIALMGRLDNKDVRENTEHAVIDTRIHDMRVAAALHPTAIEGHSICIRKHRKVNLDLDDYVDQMRRTNEMVEREDIEPPYPTPDGEGLKEWLAWMVRTRKNFVVSGGTSTGKTTFLNALLSSIPEDERVLVIEDVPELNVKVPNLVRFETNNQAGLDMRRLVKLALRYRPDRIVVGEVRGAETFDLLQAMNSGHDGGCCSLHANNAAQALSKLETYVLTAETGWPLEAIRNQIGSTIEYCIQMGRTNGRRHIKEIIKVEGYDGRRYQTKVIFG
jgi:Flp pilus assembly CpaF family ATPase